MLSVVTSYLSIGETLLIRQVAHLESIARGDEQGKAARSKLLDDWLEERNMRRVIEVDPDR